MSLRELASVLKISAGFQEPEETVIDLSLGYTSAVFRRDPTLAPPWKILIVYPKRPDHRRSCLLFPPRTIAGTSAWAATPAIMRRWIGRASSRS